MFFLRFLRYFYIFFKRNFFIFVSGNSDFSEMKLNLIYKEISLNNSCLNEEFENNFSKLIGSGKSLSYAAARMGLYHLLKELGIGKNDEVILLGSTCSVMPNAIIRTGATPIYSDVDKETFGSSLTGIKNCISKNTKVIIAQHSYGIPCEIDKIKDFLKGKNIFLVEDCALTVGSKIKNKNVGTFGDAAIFSFDHTKPINLFMGGVLYTENVQLFEKLKNSWEKIENIPVYRQKKIWKEFIFENKFFRNNIAAKGFFISKLRSFFRKIFFIKSPFLDDDFGTSYISDYPYPARMPSFLCSIGLEEIKNFEKFSEAKKVFLKNFIKLIKELSLENILPKSYLNDRLDIIPSRICFQINNGSDFRKRLRFLIDVDSTWFLEPIIVRNEPLENFLYNAGSCKNSEEIGPKMINIPVSNSKHINELLLKKLKKFLFLLN